MGRELARRIVTSKTQAELATSPPKQTNRRTCLDSYRKGAKSTSPSTWAKMIRVSPSRSTRVFERKRKAHLHDGKSILPDVDQTSPPALVDSDVAEERKSRSVLSQRGTKSEKSSLDGAVGWIWPVENVEVTSTPAEGRVRFD